MEATDAYKDAKEHVERKIRFYRHVAVFAVLGTALVVMNVARSPDRLWSLWVLFGWGVVLAIKAAKVYLPMPGEATKQRMIEAEMKKRQNQQ